MCLRREPEKCVLYFFFVPQFSILRSFPLSGQIVKRRSSFVRLNVDTRFRRLKNNLAEDKFLDNSNDNIFVCCLKSSSALAINIAKLYLLMEVEHFGDVGSEVV